MPKQYLAMTLNHGAQIKITAGVVVALGISVCVTGLMWTVLFSLSVMAALKAYQSINDGQSEAQRNSFENLYSADGATSKQKRLLAKKKEKYERKNIANQEGLHSDDSGVLAPGLSSDLLEYSISEDFEGGYTQNINLSCNEGGNRQRIPSLKSPQPLLSAVKSRVCLR